MVLTLRLQRFCFCCSLRLGTWIIGTIGWIANMLKMFWPPIFHASDDTTFNQNTQWEVSQVALVGRICFVVLCQVVTTLLAIGVYKKNKTLMLPWLVTECFGCILLSVLCAFCFGALIVLPDNHATILLTLGITLLLLSTLSWYCWLCVWSYYMELPNRRRTSSSNIQYQSSNHDITPPDADVLV